MLFGVLIFVCLITAGCRDGESFDDRMIIQTIKISGDEYALYLVCPGAEFSGGKFQGSFALELRTGGLLASRTNLHTPGSEYGISVSRETAADYFFVSGIGDSGEYVLIVFNQPFNDTFISSFYLAGADAISPIYDMTGRKYNQYMEEFPYTSGNFSLNGTTLTETGGKSLEIDLSEWPPTMVIA